MTQREYHPKEAKGLSGYRAAVGRLYYALPDEKRGPPEKRKRRRWDSKNDQDCYVPFSGTDCLIRSLYYCRGLRIAAEQGRVPTLKDRMKNDRVVSTSNRASMYDAVYRAGLELGFYAPRGQSTTRIKGPLLTQVCPRVEHIVLRHQILDARFHDEVDVWREMERAKERFDEYWPDISYPFGPYSGGLACIEIEGKRFGNKESILIHIHLLAELRTDRAIRPRPLSRRERWLEDVWLGTVLRYDDSEQHIVHLQEVGQTARDIKDELMYLHGTKICGSKQSGPVRLPKLIAPYAGYGKCWSDRQLRLLLAGYAWPEDRRKWLGSWHGNTRLFKKTYGEIAHALKNSSEGTSQETDAECHDKRRAGALRVPDTSATNTKATRKKLRKKVSRRNRGRKR